MHFRIGNSLLSQGNATGAMANYRKAVVLGGDWPELYINLGSCLEATGEFEEAGSCYRKLESICTEIGSEDVDFRRIYRRLAEPYWYRGYLDKGADMYRMAHEAQKRAHARSRPPLELADKNVLLPPWWVHSFGDTAELDYYVKMAILGWLPHETTAMLFGPEEHVANRHLLEYWRPFIRFITDPGEVERLYPYAETVDIPRLMPVLRDGRPRLFDQVAAMAHRQWESEDRPPLLTLTEKDSRRGARALKKMGVPEDAWFVTLHVREGGFMREDIHPPQVRNADIETYMPAIESIVERGGWVIRLGDPLMKEMTPMPGVIDYGHSVFKSEWMDVFLCAKCRFFVGTGSGPRLVAPAFGVPVVVTNMAPIRMVMTYSSRNIFIPKLLWSEKEERYLTIAEALSSRAGCMYFVKELEETGVRTVENTSEEINDVVVEMLDRFDGKLEYNAEDDGLQEAFWTLAASFEFYGSGRMGRDFIRKYAELVNLELQPHWVDGMNSAVRPETAGRWAGRAGR